MADEFDVLDGIDSVKSGSAKAAVNYFKAMWRKTDGDIGDELAEVLLNVAGVEADEFDKLVTAFIEREVA